MITRRMTPAEREAWFHAEGAKDKGGRPRKASNENVLTKPTLMLSDSRR